MSLEIVDLDESSSANEIQQKPSIRMIFNDLPYLRKDYIQLMKPLHEKISVQQIQIERGNEQIEILLRQLGTVLNERTRLFKRVAEIKGFFNDKQNKRFKPINMTKKDVKAKFNKCDNILESTINKKDLIKADALNNMALFAQQKMELSRLENQYRMLSSVVNNSVNTSIKEKIVELNLRLENFHVLTDYDFQEKLNLMEMERNSLIIKLMEKEKQEEMERRKYKQYLKQMKEEEKQKSRSVINENNNNSNRSKTTKRDLELIDGKRARRNRNQNFYNDDYDDDYEDENEKIYVRKNTSRIKKQPQTTKDVIRNRPRKVANRRYYNADSEDNDDDEDRNYKLEPRRTNRTKKKAKSPKPQNLKKILDEEIEEKKKIVKKHRTKSVTVTKKKEIIKNNNYDDDYEEENDYNVRKTNRKSRQNSPQKRAAIQKPTKKTTTTRRKKV